ncbi:MAG: hypothetical protein IJ498_08820 [Akkermansia sp.]|nr:hypothetical protein [Akkermansia sp.]
MGRRKQRGVFSDRGAGRARLVRYIVLIVCGIIGLLLTIGIIAWYQLLSYLQGDTFRHKICRELQAATHAESVSMRDNLRIDGNTVAQSELQLRGLGIIESIGAERILAHIERGELLDRKLHIRKLTMEEGSVTLRTEGNEIAPPAPLPGLKKAATDRKDTTRKQPSAATADSAASPTTRGFTPKSLQLDFAECRDTGFILYHGKKKYSLSGCNITAKPMSNGNSWNVEMENGRLHTPFTLLRDSNIKTATLLCHDTGYDLTECRLMLTPGELRARAHYDKETANWSAVLQLNKASVARLLRNDWQKKLTGELFGKCILRGGSASLRSAEGNLSLRSGVLEGLPFLSELSIDNTRPYRRIELEKADCDIIYPYSAPERNLHNAWLFDKIDILSRGGTLIIRGHVIIAEEGALGGQLRIGFPRHIADRLPLPGNRFTSALFNGQGEAGYAWVNINLSGTVDSPKEDLSVRLSTLLSRSLPGMALDSAGNMLHKLFESAGQKPADNTEESSPEEQDSAPEEVIINKASDLLNKGLQSIF